MNIHNFANRYLSEYTSIFPNVATLLDHLLFVVGNSFGFDEESGMIVDSEGCSIDAYNDMSDKEWDDLLSKCIEKEKKYAIRFNFTDAMLEKNIALYKKVDISETAFSEDNLLSQIEHLDSIRKMRMYGDMHYRPYPISKKHSLIYRLNESTPIWFLHIVLNFCNAWRRFLDARIETGDVAILEGDERDYGDLEWTRTHKNMISDLANRIGDRIGEQNESFRGSN